ncbi:WD40-repeat-containing domain protein, partial [Achaetomium macrosporum]
TVRLWDAATGAHRQTLEGHSGWIRAVAFSPDGKTLASASHDRTTLEGHSGWVYAVAFSPDGKTLATNYGSLRLSSTSVSPDRKFQDRALFVDGEWMTLDGKGVLWLPNDYRATSAALYESTVVLGHRSGGLTFLRFSLS